MSNIETTKSFLKDNQERILFGIILILMAIISFRAGMLKEREVQTSNIEVHVSNPKALTENEKKALTLGLAVQRKGLTGEVEKINVDDGVAQENCKFIGSKNSDKYHTPSCSWAKRIKKENIVCFDSVKEAQEKGYKPGSCNNK